MYNFIIINYFLYKCLLKDNGIFTLYEVEDSTLENLSSLAVPVPQQNCDSQCFINACLAPSSDITAGLKKRFMLKYCYYIKVKR
jgi:hypothetical protein